MKHVEEFGDVQCYLKQLSTFPIPNLDSTLEIVDLCSSMEINQLVEKTHSFSEQKKTSDYIFE
jgi:hypothetical protein